MEHLDYSTEITKKIESIKNKVYSGEISLLDVELVSIFTELKDTLNIHNLSKYSITYEKIFQLLNQKFEELKLLLSSLDNEKVFLNYLNSKPEDSEIYQLFEECWREPFTINTLSLDFLESSKEKLDKRKGETYKIEHVDKIDFKDNFLLEIPTHKFTEKMMLFFNSIKDKLPCSYDEIFIEEKSQVKLFKNFVYLLHLLQLGKVQYQKVTGFLYL